MKLDTYVNFWMYVKEQTEIVEHIQLKNVINQMVNKDRINKNYHEELFYPEFIEQVGFDISLSKNFLKYHYLWSALRNKNGDIIALDNHFIIYSSAHHYECYAIEFESVALAIDFWNEFVGTKIYKSAKQVTNSELVVGDKCRLLDNCEINFDRIMSSNSKKPSYYMVCGKIVESYHRTISSDDLVTVCETQRLLRPSEDWLPERYKNEIIIDHPFLHYKAIKGTKENFERVNYAYPVNITQSELNKWLVDNGFEYSIEGIEKICVLDTDIHEIVTRSPIMEGINFNSFEIKNVQYNKILPEYRVNLFNNEILVG